MTKLTLIILVNLLTARTLPQATPPWAQENNLLSHVPIGSSIGSSTPWLTTLTSPGPNNEFRWTSSPEEYHRILGQCLSIRNEVSKRCHETQHSCKNRCRLTDFEWYHCNCDPICLLYKDCCWDFKAECPNLAERFRKEYGHTQLAHARIECVQRSPVIESCRNLNVTGNKTPDQRDLRMPVVVSTMDNLLFRNISVYYECMGSQSRGSPSLPQTLDHFVGLRKGGSKKSIEEFLTHGTADEDVYVFTLKMSATMKYRPCRGVYRIVCSDFPANHTCYPASKNFINVHGSNQLCSHVLDSSLNAEHTDDLFVHLFRKNKALELNTDRTSSQTHHSFSKMTPLEQPNTELITPSLPTTLSTMKTLQIHPTSPKCRILRLHERKIKQLNSEDFDLAMGMDFSRGVNQPKLDVNAGHPSYNMMNEHLESYDCEDDNEDAPCNIITTCREGFMGVDLICRKPTFFLVRVVGTEGKRSSMLENLVLYIIRSVQQHSSVFRGFDRTKINNRMEVMYTNAGFKSVSNYLAFNDQVNLGYGGAELPVTDLVTQRLQALFRESVITRNIVREITLCFLMSEDQYHDNTLLCDRLVPISIASLVLTSHFRIPGIKLPDPFVDTAEVHTSLARRNCRPSDLGVLAFLAVLASGLLTAHRFDIMVPTTTTTTATSTMKESIAMIILIFVASSLVDAQIQSLTTDHSTSTTPSYSYSMSALLRNTQTSTQWPTKDPSTPGLALINDDDENYHEASKTKSIEDEIELLVTCPASRNQLRNRCNKSKLSCKDRCGSRQAAFDCKCDDRCIVYNDCCWDFEEQCPDLIEQFHEDFGPRLAEKFHASCLLDSTVIDGCEGLDLAGDKTDETLDLRNPIVNVNNALSFRNISVYRHCMELRNRSDTIASWGFLLGLKKGASIKSVQQFFLNGTLYNDTDVMPVRQGPLRECVGSFELQCTNIPRKHALCRDVSMQTLRLARSNVNDLCRRVSSNESLQQSHTQDTSRCRIIPFFMKTSPREIYGNSDQYHVIIAGNFGTENVDLLKPVFYKGRYGLDEMNKNLYRYKCAEDSGEKSCNILAVCRKGFFAVNLVCRKPDVFVIEVVGVGRDVSLGLENIVLDVFRSVHKHSLNFDAFNRDQIKNRMNTIYSNDSNYKAVMNFLPFIDEIDIAYRGVRLPTTPQVQNALKGSVIIKTLVRKVILCFLLREDPYRDNMLLCDRLVPNTTNRDSIVLDSHFGISGVKLPDPFVDIPEVFDIKLASRGLVMVVSIATMLPSAILTARWFGCS